MAVEPAILNRDTPPDDPAQRAIWEAAHALSGVFEALQLEFGWGAAVHALLIAYTQQMEASGNVPTAIEQLQYILETWRAGRRMHMRDGEGGRA